jgi:hypothetical protein
MRTQGISIAPLFLLAVAVGCNEQNAPNDVLTEPSPSTSHAPANTGPVVVMFEDYWALLGNSNEEKTLVSVIGLGVMDPSESFVCDGTATPDVFSWQLLFEPSGPIGVLLKGSEVTVHVYAYDDYFDQANTTNCDRVTSPLLALGTGNFVINDNDVFLDGTRVNSFGWRAQGTLTDLVNGGCARYTEEQRSIWMPGDDNNVFVARNIRLHHIGSNSCMQ